MLGSLSVLFASYTSQCVQVRSKRVCRLNAGRPVWLIKSSPAIHAVRNRSKNYMDVFGENFLGPCICGCSSSYNLACDIFLDRSIKTSIFMLLADLKQCDFGRVFTLFMVKSFPI